MGERRALRSRVLRNYPSSEVATRVEALREQADDYRRYIAQLDALPPDQAIKLVRARAALGLLTRRVVDIGETFVVELELSSSPSRSNEGLSCLTLMPGLLLPVG